MNVLEDVTADNWTVGDTAVLVDAGPVDYDQQRVTLSTINADSIVMSANVDSAQYPGARIYLSRRNVSVRSNGTSSSQPIIDFSSATTRSGKFGCEVINISGTGTTFYGYGFNSGSGHNISGTVTGCTTGISYAGFDLFGTLLNNTTNIIYEGINGGQLIRGRAFQPSGISSWSAGGKMGHETSIIPTGYSYSHKFTYEDVGYWNEFRIEMHKTNALLIQIPCFAKHDATGLTEDQRLHFQIIKMADDSVVAEWIAADSTDWQSSIITYQRSDFVPLVLRIAAKRASGIAYALTGTSTIQTGVGSYSFGG
jgi:hypothetical protein